MAVRCPAFGLLHFRLALPSACFAFGLLYSLACCAFGSLCPRLALPYLLPSYCRLMRERAVLNLAWEHSESAATARMPLCYIQRHSIESELIIRLSVSVIRKPVSTKLVQNRLKSNAWRETTVRSPPSTVASWRVNLSTPQSFLPRDTINRAVEFQGSIIKQGS